MLKRLEISNYALIENMNLTLTKGFTTITGETGAGKSILLKALNLLLGERADIAILKQSEKKCILEAEFEIADLGLAAYFERHELDYEPVCILRREFNSAGKSRAFVNDTPVQMQVLKELGEQLVSVHTQHQTLHILNTDFQLDILDHFSGIHEEVKNYRAIYKSYRSKVNELIELQVKEMENRKEKDYLSFLLNELEDAQLGKLNIEELQQKAARIENGEKIQTAIRFAKSVFENESFSPSVGIRTLIETFDDLKKFDSSYADIAARLWSLKIELDDLESEIDRRDNDDHYSDEEVCQIKEKIDQVNNLFFKHNVKEVGQLIELQTSLSLQLGEISSLETKIETLEKEINQLKKEVEQAAKTIRQKRLANKPKLELEVKKRLAELAMPNAELSIDLAEKQKPGKNGFDEIDFLFKTNLGGQFSPVKKVASGGELSRLMLTILSILSETKNLPTLIFDEIDTGVSGEVATKMANEFDKMGKRMQVIAITHLPQVAAKAATQLHVKKTTEESKTKTFVEVLDRTARIDVLASMMSGAEISKAAKENAADLLGAN
jgi:DNA repair protein RecN (Recombination protein N)